MANEEQSLHNVHNLVHQGNFLRTMRLNGCFFHSYHAKSYGAPKTAHTKYQPLK